MINHDDNDDERDWKPICLRLLRETGTLCLTRLATKEQQTGKNTNKQKQQQTSQTKESKKYKQTKESNKKQHNKQKTAKTEEQQTQPTEV